MGASSPLLGKCVSDAEIRVQGGDTPNYNGVAPRSATPSVSFVVGVPTAQVLAHDRGRPLSRAAAPVGDVAGLRQGRAISESSAASKASQHNSDAQHIAGFHQAIQNVHDMVEKQVEMVKSQLRAELGLVMASVSKRLAAAEENVGGRLEASEARVDARLATVDEKVGAKIAELASIKDNLSSTFISEREDRQRALEEFRHELDKEQDLRQGGVEMRERIEAVEAKFDLRCTTFRRELEDWCAIMRTEMDAVEMSCSVLRSEVATFCPNLDQKLTVISQGLGALSKNSNSLTPDCASGEPEALVFAPLSTGSQGREACVAGLASAEEASPPHDDVPPSAPLRGVPVADTPAEPGQYLLPEHLHGGDDRPGDPLIGAPAEPGQYPVLGPLPGGDYRPGLAISKAQVVDCSESAGMVLEPEAPESPTASSTGATVPAAPWGLDPVTEIKEEREVVNLGDSEAAAAGCGTPKGGSQPLLWPSATSSETDQEAEGDGGELLQTRLNLMLGSEEIGGAEEWLRR